MRDGLIRTVRQRRAIGWPLESFNDAMRGGLATNVTHMCEDYEDDDAGQEEVGREARQLD